jgi:SpoVK/Ycf46/Vps4 family AAA+-type ATPase
MATQLEFLRSLLLAHFRGDDGAFRTAVLDIIENERQVNRPVVAAELERILRDANAPSRRNGTGPLHGVNGSNGPPKDRDKNAPLLEIVEPRREIEELVLSPTTREPLTRVIAEWRKAEILKAHGLRPASKLLFHGPPGCGKTVAAESLAKALFLPLATVRFDALVSSFLGETASNLRRVFDHARARPMVLLFDEFDAVGKERTVAEEHGELKRVVNSFLQLLDGFRADTLLVAATNHEGLLDPALWRRFDEVVAFPRPTSSEAETLLVRHFRQFPLAPGVKLKEFVRSLDGASHADIERTAVAAIKQAVLDEDEAVSSANLRTAADSLRNRLRTAQGDDGMPSGAGGRSQTKKRQAD